MRNDTVIQVRLPTDLKEQAQRLLEAEGSTFSTLVRETIEAYVAEHEDEDVE